MIGAHECQNGHEPIRHNNSDDDERCPLCRLIDENDDLKRERNRLKRIIRRRDAALDAALAKVRA